MPDAQIAAQQEVFWYPALGLPEEQAPFVPLRPYRAAVYGILAGTGAAVLAMDGARCDGRLCVAMIESVVKEHGRTGVSYGTVLVQTRPHPPHGTEPLPSLAAMEHASPVRSLSLCLSLSLTHARIGGARRHAVCRAGLCRPAAARPGSG
jgi:hypothetical protein